MNEILQRRRALMKATEKPWEVMNFPLTSFRGYGVSYDSASDSLHFIRDSASAYASVNENFTTQEGYEYEAECDVVVTSGASRIAVRKANNRIVKQSEITTTSAHLILNFSHDSEITKFTLFGTYATAAIPDVTYSNFVLRRRAI